MKSLAFLSAITAIGVSLGVYACTNDDPGLNLWNTSGGSGATTSTTGSGSTSSGGTTGIGSNTSTAKGGTTGINTSGTDLTPDAACGSGDQPAERTPVYMIFMYDKSGSMGDDPVTAAELADSNPANDTPAWQNNATRWEPMKLGMSDFFTNSGTAGNEGIEASLEFFPANGDKVTTCHADYKTPAVMMTPLSTPANLIAALDRTVPGGGTPTLPAVIGGIAYAKQLMANNIGSKAVLVLVTDGEPAIYVADPVTGAGTIDVDCAPSGYTLTNTIADIVTVVNAAYRGTPQVLTYVIGIGEAQGEMSAIASAGGTEYLQLDATEPPETTRKRLTEKLQSIRTTAIPCSVKLPSTFDYGTQWDKVNVSFKHTDGTVEEFKKAPSGCAQPGWYFDNDTNPKTIELCPALCSGIQNDLTGKVQILLGCKTRLI